MVNEPLESCSHWLFVDADTARVQRFDCERRVGRERRFRLRTGFVGFDVDCDQSLQAIFTSSHRRRFLAVAE